MLLDASVATFQLLNGWNNLVDDICALVCVHLSVKPADLLQSVFVCFETLTLCSLTIKAFYSSCCWALLASSFASLTHEHRFKAV